MAKVLCSRDHGVVLELEDDGRHVLHVLCGGVAQYPAELTLSPEEVAAWAAGGADYLHDLAWRVERDPRAFGDRLR